MAIDARKAQKVQEAQEENKQGKIDELDGTSFGNLDMSKVHRLDQPDENLDPATVHFVGILKKIIEEPTVGALADAIQKEAEYDKIGELFTRIYGDGDRKASEEARKTALFFFTADVVEMSKEVYMELDGLLKKYEETAGEPPYTLENIFHRGDPDQNLAALFHLYNARRNTKSIAAIRPDKYLAMNDKLSNYIPVKEKNLFSPNGFALTMSGNNPNMVLSGHLEMQLPTVDEGVNITDKSITADDMINYFAIVTLYKSGNLYFTPAMVSRVANGKLNTEYQSEQQVRETEKSIEKFCRAYVEVNLIDMIHAGYKLKNPSIETIGRQMLSVDYLIGNVNGNRAKVYFIKEEPALFTIANQLNQVISFPPEMLDIQETKDGKLMGVSIPITKTRRVINWHLIRRLKRMETARKSHKLSDAERTITFSNIFDAAGCEKSDRKKRSTIRGYVVKVLDYWKIKGFIKNYEIIKTGRRLDKIRITLMTAPQIK